MAREATPSSRGLYSISTAAELAGVHPQTLRAYESKGLLRPERTQGGTRRYSDADIARLRRIKDLTELGLNLAGVRLILEMEDETSRLSSEIERLARELLAARQDLIDEVAATHAQYRREVVPFVRPPGEIARRPRNH